MARTAVLAIGFLVTVLAVIAPRQTRAAERLDVSTIKLALKASEEENQGFIERVVERMNEGRLSRASVTVAFGQAKKQAKHKFQYFKQAMIRLADREGVSLAPEETRSTTERNWWQRIVARVRRLAQRVNPAHRG